MTRKSNWIFQRFVSSVILLMQINARIIRIQHTQLKMNENDFSVPKTVSRDPALLPSAFDIYPLHGKLKSNHFNMIKIPQCGLPRIIKPSTVKWTMFDLSWCLEKPSKKISVCEQRVTLELAFRIWSRNTVFRFREVPCNEADIRFSFNLGYPSNEYHSDGQGGHQIYIDTAYTKKDGLKSVNVYFDGAENWKTDDTREASLLFAAAHGIGHSLALGHSSDQRSIMSYSFYFPVTELSPADKISLQNIYGKSVTTEQNNPETTTIPKINETTKNIQTQTIVPEATKDSLRRSLKPEVDTTTYFNNIPAGRSSLLSLDLKTKPEGNTRNISQINNNPDSVIVPKEKSDQNLKTVIISNTIPQSTETPFTENLGLGVFPESKVDYIQTGSSSPFKNVLTHQITSKNDDDIKFINTDSKIVPTEKTDETVKNIIIQNTNKEWTKNNLNENFRPETETKPKFDNNETGSTSSSGFALKNNTDIRHTTQPVFYTAPTEQIEQHLNTVIISNTIPQSTETTFTENLRPGVFSESKVDYIQTESSSPFENVLTNKITNKNKDGVKFINTDSKRDEIVNNVMILHTNIELTKNNLNENLRPETETKPKFDNNETGSTSSSGLALKNNTDIRHTIQPVFYTAPTEQIEQHLNTVVISNKIPQSTETPSTENLRLGVFPNSKVDYMQTRTNKITNKNKNVTKFINPDLKMEPTEKTDEIVNRITPDTHIEATKNYFNDNLRPETETESKFDNIETGSTSLGGFALKNKKDMTHNIQPGLNRVPTDQIDQHLYTLIPENNISQNRLNENIEPKTYTKSIIDYIKTGSLSLFKNILKFKTQNNQTGNHIIHPTSSITTTKRIDQLLHTVNISDTNRSQILFNETQLLTDNKDGFTQIQNNFTDSKAINYSSRFSHTLETQLTTVATSKSSLLQKNGTFSFSKEVEYSSKVPNSVGTQHPTLNPSMFSRVYKNRSHSKTLHYSSTPSNIAATRLPTLKLTKFSGSHLHRPFSKELGSSRRPNVLATSIPTFKPTRFTEFHKNSSFTKTLKDSSRTSNIVATSIPTFKPTRSTEFHKNHSFAKTLKDSSRPSKIVDTWIPTRFTEVHRSPLFAKTLKDSSRASKSVATLKEFTGFSRINMHLPFSKASENSRSSNIVATQRPTGFARIQRNRHLSLSLDYSSRKSDIEGTQLPRSGTTRFNRVSINHPFSKTLKDSSSQSNIGAAQSQTFKQTRSNQVEITRPNSKALRDSSRPPHNVNFQLSMLKPTKFSRVNTNQPFSKTSQNSPRPTNILATQLPRLKPTMFIRVNTNQPFSKTSLNSPRPTNILATQLPRLKPTNFSRVNTYQPFSKTSQNSPRPQNILATKLSMLKPTRSIRVQRNQPFPKDFEDSPRSSNTYTPNLSTVNPPSAFGRLQRSGPQSQRLADPPAISGILTTQSKPQQNTPALISSTSSTEFSRGKLIFNPKTLILANSRDIGFNATLAPLFEHTKLLTVNDHNIENTSTVPMVHDDHSKYQCRCDSKIDHCEGLFCWFWEKVLEVCCQFYRWICSVFRKQFE